MAAGIMPAMTEPTVCETECQHRDCAALRHLAQLDCELCGRRVEAGERFYDVEVRDGRSQRIEHAACAEDAEEKRRAQFPKAGAK